MEYFVIILVSYLIGTINPAYIITRIKKRIDIRKTGSNNAGTSNVAMTLGLRYAIIVGLLDMFKGFLPVLIVRLVFPDNDILWVVAGLSSVLGHVYPFNLGFHGGKGTATFGGVCFALFPWVSLIAFVLFFIVLIISDYIVVPTMIAIVLIPITMLFLDFQLISIGLVVIYSILSIYKHMPNLKRIYRKEEVGLREGLRKPN